MGLSGGEREFLQRLLDMPDGTGFQIGTRYYGNVHFSTVLAEGEKVIQSLIRRGYCSSSHDPLTAKITEAGAEAMNAEKKTHEAYAKGMEGGKKIYSKAVAKLRGKLADQQVPTMLNKIYKHFIRKEGLTEDDKALLEQGKSALQGEKTGSLQPNIIINGREVQVGVNVFSYGEILMLAGYTSSVIDRGGITVAVTMTPKDQGPRAFSLTPDDSFFREPGSKVVINAVRTDNA